MPIARAAGAQSAVQRTATMVGAGAAGALVALLGPMPALVVDAGGFLISALLVRASCRVSRHHALEIDGEDVPADASAGGFVAGIRFVVTSPLLRAIVVLVTLTNAIDAAGVMVLKPLYATEVLGDPALLGFMVGCFAAGALAGSALFGASGHRYSGRVMFATCFVLAGAPPYLAMAVGAPVPVLLPVLAASGLAAGALNPMIATAMYGVIPNGMRARVFGATTAGVAATMPLGALLGGFAAEQFGLVPTLVVRGRCMSCSGQPALPASVLGARRRPLARARGGESATGRGIRPARRDDAGGMTRAELADAATPPEARSRRLSPRAARSRCRAWRSGARRGGRR